MPRMALYAGLHTALPGGQQPLHPLHPHRTEASKPLSCRSRGPGSVSHWGNSVVTTLNVTRASADVRPNATPGGTTAEPGRRQQASKFCLPKSSGISILSSRSLPNRERDRLVPAKDSTWAQMPNVPEESKKQSGWGAQERSGGRAGDVVGKLSGIKC